MPRNPFGNIRKHEVIQRGKRITVYDVSKRFKDAQGKNRKLFKRCFSKAEAQVQLNNFQNEARTVAIVDHGFSELTAYYRAEYVQAAVFVGGRKVSGYRRNLTHVENILLQIEEHFGNAPVRSITYEQLRGYQEMIAQTLTVRDTFPAVSTINEKLSMLRRLFNIAIQLDWLDINPFRRGKSLIDRAAETKRNRMLTFEEEARLLAALNIPKRRHVIPVVICALDTAMRRGEIFNLEWWQIDLENRVIYIKDKAAAETKTGFGGVLPISERLHQILTNLYKLRHSDNSVVFFKFEYKRAFNGACADAKIDNLQFRDLRSTAATRMVLAGNAESQVMKVTRHRNLKIFLENYSNVDVLNARRIGDNLSKFIENRGATSNATSNRKKKTR